MMESDGLGINGSAQPPRLMQFCDDNDEVIGTLTCEKGKLKFEGEVEPSAKIFVEALKRYFDE